MILTLWALGACTGLGPGSDGISTRVEELWVEPTDLTLTVREGEPQELQFTAFARLQGGIETEITLVSWSSSNLSAGDITDTGLFTSVDTNGGVTEVTAAHLGLSASSTITVVFARDIVQDGLDEALPTAWADAVEPASGGPSLLYPLDGVTVPRNLEGLTFLWSETEGNDVVYRLRLRSGITDISLYTTEFRYTATAELWEQIAAANRQGEVEVTVESARWSGGTLSDRRVSASTKLSVNRLDADGSVLYWSTQNLGIMRIPFGETVAEPFYSGDQKGMCVGCHAVVEDIDRMVVTHDGINGVFSVVNIFDPGNPTVVVNTNDSNRFTFKTVSPDGQYILGSIFGKLKLYKLSTGELIKDLTPAGTYMAQPDWSPTGDQIVAVNVTSTQDEFRFTGGELVVMDWDESKQSLSTPQVLVPRDSNYNFYYPAWSPDGEWVAYNRTVGGGYASAKAEVMLVKADGSVDLRLDMANGEGELQNSYPRWGPLPDSDVLWLAFSSKRDYAPADFGLPQIWVSAIDTAKAEQGQDPSSAPFWLPGQSTMSDNHLPYWWGK